MALIEGAPRKKLHLITASPISFFRDNITNPGSVEIYCPLSNFLTRSVQRALQARSRNGLSICRLQVHFHSHLRCFCLDKVNALKNSNFRQHQHTPFISSARPLIGGLIAINDCTSEEFSRLHNPMNLYAQYFLRP